MSLSPATELAVGLSTGLGSQCELADLIGRGGMRAVYYAGNHFSSAAARSRERRRKSENRWGRRDRR